MVTRNMTPTKFREHLSGKEREDAERLVEALDYVREDGRSGRLVERGR